MIAYSLRESLRGPVPVTVEGLPRGEFAEFVEYAVF